MAKLNGNAKYLGFALTALLVIASIVASYTLLQAKSCTLEESLDKLESDGCKPSRTNHEEIILIQKDLQYIREGVDEIKKKLP